jgi:hypothetical protein
MANRWDNRPRKLTKEFALELLERNSKDYEGHKLLDFIDITTKYGRLSFRGKKFLGHRLSAWIYFNLPLYSEDLVLHKQICQYKNCWNPEHIYIGNASDNNKDAYKLGNRDKLLLRNTMRNMRKING